MGLLAQHRSLVCIWGGRRGREPSESSLTAHVWGLYFGGDHATALSFSVLSLAQYYVRSFQADKQKV